MRPALVRGSAFKGEIRINAVSAYEATLVASELEQFTESSVPTNIAALGLLGVLHGAVQYGFHPNGVAHLLSAQRPSALFLRKIVERALQYLQSLHALQ
jgi:hypothetical protein